MAKCAFCTRQADSNEHIFSKWMIKLLPRHINWKAVELITHKGEYVTYPQKRVDLRANVVCEHCNNRWMSVLEDKHIKPAIGHLLLGNQTAIFGAREIASIAAYAFKTTVLANHKKLREQPFFTSSERFRFRKSLIIPDGFQVWIACRKSAYYTTHWHSRYGKLDQKHPLGFRYYSCTWNFVNFVIQTIHGKWEHKGRRKTLAFPQLPQDRQWSQASIQIWPPNGDTVTWPPPLYIGDDTFDTFRSRWNSITFDATVRSSSLGHISPPPESC